MTRLRPLFAALLLVLALGGCYMPIYFDAEIEIDRHGYYSIIFDGYMTKVELYKDIQEGTVSQAEIDEQLAVVKRDFERDPSTKSFEYVKDGIFRVHWERSGDLLQARSVTFFRRNENFLTLQYLKDQGVITMTGVPVSRENAKRLMQMGLNAEGEIRVKTDARIRDHNATKVVGKSRRKMLVWKIRSLADPAPSMMVTLR